MTREEAIKYAEFRESRLEVQIWENDCAYGNYAMYSTELSFVKAALAALRPVSREQVEKVWSWRGEWVGVPNMGVYDTACSKCGYCPGIRFWSSDFCPHCGAPLTGEAVDMVMERLEALNDV